MRYVSLGNNELFWGKTVEEQDALQQELNAIRLNVHLDISNNGGATDIQNTLVAVASSHRTRAQASLINQRRNPLEKLSNELLLYIFGYLTREDTGAMPWFSLVSTIMEWIPSLSTPLDNIPYARPRIPYQPLYRFIAPQHFPIEPENAPPVMNENNASLVSSGFLINVMTHHATAIVGVLLFLAGITLIASMGSVLGVGVAITGSILLVGHASMRYGFFTGQAHENALLPVVEPANMDLLV